MLPSGTVTFLFTDIEGSSQLWEKYPQETGEALAHHDAILRDAIQDHQGFIVKTTEYVWRQGASMFLMNVIAEESAHDKHTPKFVRLLESYEHLK